MSVFDALTARMGWLNQKTQVSADNIARMNMPGEKARVLEEMSFNGSLKTVTLAKTDPRHLDGSHPKGAAKTRISKAAAVTMSGSNIDYQQELQNANDASAQHLQMTKTYGAFAKMVRTALGK